MHDGTRPDIPTTDSARPHIAAPSLFAEQSPAALGESATRFRSRRDAGASLAQALRAYAGRDDLLVLAISPSSVAVAHEVSSALSSPLDLLLTQAIGAPAHDSLVLGAVVSGGAIALDRELVSRLRVPMSYLRDTIVRARAELERRERSHRGERPLPRFAGRAILLVADGVSSAMPVRGAIAVLRRAGATRVVAAVPVAPAEICAQLQRAADECVCLRTPKPYYGAGAWYEDFREPSPDETRALLGD